MVNNNVGIELRFCHRIFLVNGDDSSMESLHLKTLRGVSGFTLAKFAF